MQTIFDPKLLRKSPIRVRRVRRWIRALRSGKTYKQGNGYLRIVGPKRSEDQFCCLGVMLDLEWPKGWLDVEDTRRGYSDGTEVAHKFSHQEVSTQMPGEEACRRYGLYSTATFAEGGDSLLAHMNDNHKSFKQIALALDRALKEALKS